MAIHVKRVYAPPRPADGLRVLVDRLWPRGLRKDQATIDVWLKDIAPSAELRRWFGHAPDRWSEFKQRYFRELSEGPDRYEVLLREARKGNITLLYSAKDEAHNNAVALKELLEARLR